MAIDVNKSAGLAASLVAIICLADCSPQPPVELPAPAPPHPASTEPVNSAPAGDQSALLGGPITETTPAGTDRLIHDRRADGVEVITMPPIANPTRATPDKPDRPSPAPAPRMAAEDVAHSTAPPSPIIPIKPAKVVARPEIPAKPVSVPSTVKPVTPKVAVAPVSSPSRTETFRLPGLSAGASRSVGAAAMVLIVLAFLAFAARRANEHQQDEARRRRERHASSKARQLSVIEPPPAPVTEPDITPPAPPTKADEGRSIVQVIAEAVSDLRDGEGKGDPPKP
ncbi:MAG: hypothetical protein CGW95_12105 [Phenylobacterium zucineum]|nr:MAG: hypothetical protein CGW95_12105 [Phenylobacterium zucineum]